MEYLDSHKKIILIGLNPTKEAKMFDAVFCQTGGLWSIIGKSSLKPNGFDDIELSLDEKGKYKNFAGIVFGPKTDLGYADLVPDVFEKKGSNVKVNQQHLLDLEKKLIQTSVERIGLLGKKVTRAYLQIPKNDELSYGDSFPVKIGNRNVVAICLPFPETTPILNSEKVATYNKLKM